MVLLLTGWVLGGWAHLSLVAALALSALERSARCRLMMPIRASSSTGSDMTLTTCGK